MAFLAADLGFLIGIFGAPFGGAPFGGAPSNSPFGAALLAVIKLIGGLLLAHQIV